MSLCKGYTQGGSNADNILVDAYVKGLYENINWTTGYAALIQDAEVEPYDWSNEGKLQSSGIFWERMLNSIGRGGLDSWKGLGYIPVQDFDYKGFGTLTRSISRTLEYSYNDFVISQIASSLNQTDDSEKYAARSKNWQNLFKSDTTSFIGGINGTSVNGVNTGFTGFFQPRYLNQTWGYQDPLKCSNIDTNPNEVCSLQNNAAETFESSIWEYSL